MSEADRLTHIAGKFHARMATHSGSSNLPKSKTWKKLEKKKGKLRSDDPKWFCALCEAEMDAEARKDHLKRDKHVLNSKWKGAAVEPHRKGGVFIRIQEVPAVYGHRFKIPQGIFKRIGAFHGEWKAIFTLVTKSQVQKAFESWKAESLAQFVDALHLHGQERAIE